MRIPHRFLSVATTVALLALPAASRADADAAMDACVQAFVDATVPKDHPVTVRRIEKAESPLTAHDRAYRIVLMATGAKSGKSFGRATCTTDRNGQVVAMTGRSGTTKLASR